MDWISVCYCLINYIQIWSEDLCLFRLPTLFILWRANWPIQKCWNCMKKEIPKILHLNTHNSISTWVNAYEKRSPTDLRKNTITSRNKMKNTPILIMLPAIHKRLTKKNIQNSFKKLQQFEVFLNHLWQPKTAFLTLKIQ